MALTNLVQRLELPRGSRFIVRHTPFFGLFQKRVLSIELTPEPNRMKMLDQ